MRGRLEQTYVAPVGEKRRVKYRVPGIAYNMLEWDPGTQRWVVSVLESVNGGAFRESVAVISPHQ